MRSADYLSRTPGYYLAKMQPDILASFSSIQREAIAQALNEAMPKPSPKLVDLRFAVDLIVSRFYVVLLIGKDRRQKPRRYIPEGIAKIGNTVTAVIFLIGANFVISAFILLAIYLLKSAAGINLLPGHFPDLIKHLISS